MSIFGVFQVRIFRIWTEYGQILRNSSHIQSKYEKIQTRKTPNTDTFDTVKNMLPKDYEFFKNNSFIKKNLEHQKIKLVKKI